MRFKGNISVYVLILLGLTIGLYLFGFSSMAIRNYEERVEEQGLSDASGINIGILLSAIADAMINSLTDIQVAAPLIAFTILAGVLKSSNYQMGTLLMYIIPLAVIIFFINIIVFPVIPLIESTSPNFSTITFLLMIILNTILLLAIMELASGRKT